MPLSTTCAGVAIPTAAQSSNPAERAQPALPPWPRRATGTLELLEEPAQRALTPEASAPGSAARAWREEAACRQLPTELFFPIGHGARAKAQARLAKQVCEECPVHDQCLEYALCTNARYGVFGGLDEDERKALRRRLGDRLGLVESEDDDLGDLEESA